MWEAMYVGHHIFVSVFDIVYAVFRHTMFISYIKKTGAKTVVAWQAAADVFAVAELSLR